MTKITKRNPCEIAQAIVDHLDTTAANVEKVQIAGPGFINFYLDNAYLTEIISEAMIKMKNLVAPSNKMAKIYYRICQLTQLEIYILATHVMPL